MLFLPCYVYARNRTGNAWQFSEITLDGKGKETNVLCGFQTEIKEFAMFGDADRLCGIIEFVATERRCIVFPVKYELNLYRLGRRKYTASVV
jgi:hypothetical protein